MHPQGGSLVQAYRMRIGHPTACPIHKQMYEEQCGQSCDVFHGKKGAGSVIDLKCFFGSLGCWAALVRGA
jgi:hypothetical protein